MALSPAEIDEMKNSGELKIAVAAAVLDVANDVSSESTATSNHAARLALAKTATQSSDNMRDEFLALLLSRVSNGNTCGWNQREQCHARQYRSHTSECENRDCERLEPFY